MSQTQCQGQGPKSTRPALPALPSAPRTMRRPSKPQAPTTLVPALCPDSSRPCSRHTAEQALGTHRDSHVPSRLDPEHPTDGSSDTEGTLPSPSGPSTALAWWVVGGRGDGTLDRHGTRLP